MKLRRSEWVAKVALCVALLASGCGTPGGGDSRAPVPEIESGVTTAAPKSADVADEARPPAAKVAVPVPVVPEPAPQPRPVPEPAPQSDPAPPKGSAPRAVVEAEVKPKAADAPKEEAAAPPSGFRISAPKETVLTKDGNVSLDFVFDMPGGVGATVTQFEVTVPAGLLRYDAAVGATLANMQGSVKSIVVSELKPGVIKVVIMGLNVDVIRPGSKAVIPFKVSGERTAAWRGEITIAKVVAGSGAGDRYLTETVDGALKFAVKAAAK